ncbi:MAG: hypothetical protein OEZ57_04210 [Nitrospirota bacterium]|nr:hypothetical protein [Nitrospirota bacterium]MDH5585807.1 hypothetical protein [Nitrospirota bacterium]MDH5774103.1 hypothetical protein [Nitrospirota bacterium]
MSVFKSGAFLQQCFSVHPLTLILKLVTPPSMIGIFCTNCQMKHRLTITWMTASGVEQPGSKDQEMLALQDCSKAHPEEVRLSLVDVVKNAVEFRCYPCSRTYALNLSLVETHQSS